MKQELYQIIEEQCRAYSGKSFLDAWKQIGGSMMRKILERSMEVYLAQQLPANKKFVEEVGKMRKAQKDFYSMRSQENLMSAKKWESYIDKRLESIDTSDQLKLFE